jgi:hypothetical protein
MPEVLHTAFSSTECKWREGPRGSEIWDHLRGKEGGKGREGGREGGTEGGTEGGREGKLALGSSKRVLPLKECGQHARKTPPLALLSLPPSLPTLPLHRNRRTRRLEETTNGSSRQSSTATATPFDAKGLCLEVSIYPPRAHQGRGGTRRGAGLAWQHLRGKEGGEGEGGRDGGREGGREGRR